MRHPVRAAIVTVAAATFAAAALTVTACSGSGPTRSGTASSAKALPPAPSTGSPLPGTASPAAASSTPAASAGPGTRTRITSWAYQLQGYPSGRLDALARAPQQLDVIDLARDAHSDYFRPDEIAALHRSGKTVLAYFEIGSIEDFRPEYGPLRRDAGDLILNRWADWPNEYFVRYWDQRWWDRVVRPRVDQAVKAGFDGVYLDTPLAYEELDLSMVDGASRDSLARQMVTLIGRISRYARARHPGFWVVPQNSPELRRYPGYLDAVDGIGMEELFFLATDRPCTEDYCGENLGDTRALRAAGKLVLAVDYAVAAANVTAACRRYAAEGFVGYVSVRDLDRISPPCK